MSPVRDVDGRCADKTARAERVAAMRIGGDRAINSRSDAIFLYSPQHVPRKFLLQSVLERHISPASLCPGPTRHHRQQLFISLWLRFT